MTLPEAREQLLNLCAQLHPDHAAEVQRIIKEGMFRRRGVVPVAPKNRRMTRGVAVKIKAIHYNHPNLSEQEIATLCGVNPGRVSEALIGKRT